MSPARIDGARLFFVVGRGRSGTTLLRRMLDANPRVFVAPEALFVMNLRQRYGAGSWGERRVRELARDLWLEDRLGRWGLSRGGLERRLLAVPADRRSYRRLCLEVYAAAAEAAGKPAAALLGDKNPHYSLFVQELGDLFPGSRFVHLVRDYRDNIVSYRGVPFDLSGIAGLASRWVAYNRAILEASRREPERFHRLRYEDLVADPAARLHDLCAFLEVPFSDSMLRFESAGGELALPWHRALRGPIRREGAGRWSRELSPRQVRVADSICQPLGGLLGYSAASDAGGAGAFPGRILGELVTRLERILFRLPLRLRVAVLRGYRFATGNVIR